LRFEETKLPIIEEYSLSNKVAIVATNNDFATPFLAEVLAEAGANVFVIARRDGVVTEAVRRARGVGGEAYGTLCESTLEDYVETALRDALDRWGRVDILVNNFRTEFAKPFDGVTLDEFEAVMDWNVKTVFLLCRAVGRKMLEQGGGRIVNIISGLAERGLWNSATYCASQGAVLQLTRALALEWGRHNIRVNAIGTGWFSEEEVPPEEAQKELLVRYIPLRRRGHPRDIGPLLVYLASDACDYTTGQPVYIDGGLMAHP
jgi:NAD(P)-dependent dehydrogenase (short-subunit alcohol dehydrogenase family)